MSIILIVINAIIFGAGIVALFVVYNLSIDEKIECSRARFIIIATFLIMCLNVFTIVNSSKNFRNRVINNYKNNKYIEVVDYKYKTVDSVTTKIDSTFTYKVKRNKITF